MATIRDVAAAPSVEELVADAAQISGRLLAEVRDTTPRPDLERIEREALEGFALLKSCARANPACEEPLQPVLEDLRLTLKLAWCGLALAVGREALRDRQHPIRRELRLLSGWRREQRRAHADEPRSKPVARTSQQRPRERRDRRVRQSSAASGDPPDESDPAKRRLEPARPPHVLIELALEASPRVRVVAETEGDELRLGAWLHSRPELLALLESALALQLRGGR